MRFGRTVILTVVLVLLGLIHCTDGFSAIFNVSNTAQFRQAFENAAANGQDDTIILAAGTYKTTDDGIGTFKFIDTEAHNLTIKAADGLTANDVILDGDNAHQVLSYTNTQHSTLTLDRVSVKNGNSPNGNGAGISTNNYLDYLIVTNCVISDNTSHWGGGIYSDGNVAVTNSTISGNSASYEGGGIFSSSNATITNSTISGNSGSTNSLGGGIYIAMSGKITITNSTISGNSASGGGGIYGDSYSKITITNSTISGNSASLGGGIRSYDSLIVTNSTISGNTVSYSGGGISGGYMIITNSTISGNSAPVSGGGIRGYGTFVNNIFSSNSSDIYFVTNIVSNVWNNYIDYTKLENDVANVKKNNIQPSAGSLNFADASFRLGVGSIAIDKGLDPNSTTFAGLFTDPTTLQTVRDALVTDKDGNPRIVGSAIDLGAYEYSPYNLSISEDGSGSGRVISHPDGINCGSGNSDCFASFPMNTIVSLETIPDTGGSIFSGWSGDADCGDGQITVSSPISCTASFALCDTSSTALIGSTSYGSIWLAYSAPFLPPPPNDVIKIIASNQQETLDFNMGRTVTLDGGYDCAFTAPPLLMTTITGSVTVSSGAVIFSNIRIQ